MNRILLPLMLGLSLAPVLCWAAEPKAEEAKAIAEIGNVSGQESAETGEMGRELKTYLSAEFSPDCKILATGHDRGIIKLWDSATCERTATLDCKGDSVCSLSFSPSGKTLASAGHSGTIRVWDVASGKTATTLSGQAGNIDCMAFSPDGKSLASGSRDKTVWLWDMVAGKKIMSLSGHAEQCLLRLI